MLWAILTSNHHIYSDKSFNSPCQTVPIHIIQINLFDIDYNCQNAHLLPNTMYMSGI